MSSPTLIHGPGPPVRDDLLTKAELITKFDAANHVVFGVMLVISAGIGIIFWWRCNKTTDEFLLGGRRMGVFPVTMSLMASFVSAITMLGTPAEMYVSGTQYIVSVLCAPIVILATITLYLPVFMNLQVFTSNEYLELRFNKYVRYCGAAVFTLQMVTYNAIAVYAPSLAFSQITGLHVEASCAVIFGVCIFYTSLGGMKAVLWTDTFQSAVMFAAFMAIIIKGTMDVGGVWTVLERNYRSGRLEFLVMDPDVRVRHTLWGVMIGCTFNMLSIMGTNQTQVQRYISLENKSKAAGAVIWSNVLMSMFTLVCGYAGLVIYAFYYNCDPIATKQVKRKDQLFPLFVLQVMGDIPGMPGLFAAGVFSAALSTISSGLNSLSAVFLRDVIGSFLQVKISDENNTILARVISVFFGLASFSVIFLIKHFPGVLEACISLFGMLGGPLLGLFSLGMFLPFTNSKGAVAGFITSLVLVLWMGFGQTLSKLHGTYNQAWAPKKETSTDQCPSKWLQANVTTAPVLDPSGFTHLALYEVSYLWFGPISCLTCFIVGTVVSLVDPRNIKTLDSELVSPGIPLLWRWWPKRLRESIDGYWGQIGVTIDAEKQFGWGSHTENFDRTSLADFSRTSIADYSQSSMQANFNSPSISSSQMTVEQMEELRQSFAIFDKDQTGTIPVIELRKMVKWLGQTSLDRHLRLVLNEDQYVEDVLERYVIEDGKVTIKFSEFLEMMEACLSRRPSGDSDYEPRNSIQIDDENEKEEINKKVAQFAKRTRKPSMSISGNLPAIEELDRSLGDHTDEMDAVFKMFDMDQDGMISRAELAQIMKKLREDITEEEMERMIKEVDMEAHEKISYEKFVAIINGKQ